MKKYLKRIMKVLIILFVLIIISLVVYLLLNPKLTMEEALKLGEEKYGAFLWMVDGAFNDERYDEIFLINGNEYKHNDFICQYQDDKSRCKSTNFEESFEKLFLNGIRYNTVYGDGLSYNWYSEHDGIYTFNNNNSCNYGRMGLKQTIEPLLIERNKITYKVSFQDDEKNNLRKVEKVFVLKRENRKWKVAYAYYHDPCFMDYNIK